MKKIKLATVFSGIGGVEQTLKKMNIEHEIIFACDNGERYLDKTREELQEELVGLSFEEKQTKIKDIYDSTRKMNWVKKSYFANYDITEDQWFDDVRFLDGERYKNKVDLFVGGSPCQSFSSIGKRAGLED